MDLETEERIIEETVQEFKKRFPYTADKVEFYLGNIKVLLKICIEKTVYADAPDFKTAMPTDEIDEIEFDYTHR